VLTLVISDASAPDPSTDVHYEGDVQVGGVIAGVGQRLLDTTAKLVIRKFFEKLTELAGEASVPAAAK
jgi:carbon monoxide dehydrogenase subunit G